MKILFLAFCFSLAVPPAFGAICSSKADLEGSAEECKDNSYYGEAAVLCLQRLDAQIKASTASLNASLQNSVKKMGAAQDDHFSTTGQGYAQSAASLKSLIAVSQASRAEVDAYEDDLVWPEDITSVEERGGDVNSILQEGCYHKHLGTLELVKKDFDKRTAQLESALAQANAHGGAALGDQHNLGGGALTPAPIPAGGETAPSNQPYDPSGISGSTKEQ